MTKEERYFNLIFTYINNLKNDCLCRMRLIQFPDAFRKLMSGASKKMAYQKFEINNNDY